MRPNRRPRGFTLIELVVALALGLLLLAATSTIMVQASDQFQVMRARNALLREGNAVARLLTHELRLTGLGVPNGTHINGATGALPTALLVAAQDQVGVLLDLPRPDAQYAAFGHLHGRHGGDRQTIMWHTENNGSCAPGNNGCSVANSSVFFPGSADLCNGTWTDRTCPWGLKRVRANERLQVVDGSGRWTTGVFSTGVTVGGQTFGRLAADYADPLAVWPNNNAASAPTAVTGQGYVTTLDRVFYTYNSGSKTLTRQQCWGDPDPTHASWPTGAAVAVPAAPGSVPNNTCTPVEILSNRLAAFQLEYFDQGGAALAAPLASAATKNTVTRVRFTFRLTHKARNQVVQHEMAGAVAIRN